jgi:micrococcal nuclease
VAGMRCAGTPLLVAVLLLVAAGCLDGAGDVAEPEVPAAASTTDAAPRAPTSRGPAAPPTIRGKPPPLASGQVLRGTVTRVVDGDTVRVRVSGFDDVVRLIGIDTPETVHPSRPVECHGPEASALAERLMPVGATVRLATDPTQDVRDRYGRLLAHIHTGDRSGADTVNRALVAAGAAKVYVFRGRAFTHLEQYRAAERRAREERRGLWGPPCNGRP